VRPRDATVLMCVRVAEDPAKARVVLRRGGRLLPWSPTRSQRQPGRPRPAPHLKAPQSAAAPDLDSVETPTKTGRCLLNRSPPLATDPSAALRRVVDAVAAGAWARTTTGCAFFAPHALPVV